jgi:ferric-dicitrate binding protein FerR (iron transport regulator)
MEHRLIEKILSGQATAQEVVQFNEWLSLSKENHALYEKTKVVWERMDGIYATSTFDKSAAKIKISSKILDRKQSLPRHTARFWLSAAASVLLIIGLGTSTLYYYNLNIRNEIVYASGNSVKEIQLADGTHIWLNSESMLTVSGSFGKKQRKVFLKGEAYFEVNRDEFKPFRIHAGETVTEVLGTSFNVNLDTISGNVNVVVNSGKVGFYQSNQKKEWKILLPDDMASYHPENQSILVSTNSNLNYLSWKTGILKFYETPINEVCKVLSKQYHKQVISKVQQPNMVLTGTFQNESLNDILDVIELTLDVDATTSSNQIIIQ